MRTILGIDPGSRLTGYGIIQTGGNEHSQIDHGVIKLDIDLPMPNRLAQLLTELGQLISRHRPDTLAIEQVFVHKNIQSALKLGQARGCAMGLCAQQGMQVFEYSPRSIKQAVVGFGGADKGQVQLMIQKILQLDKKPVSDAADALAVAMCHAFQPTWLLRHKEKA